MDCGSWIKLIAIVLKLYGRWTWNQRTLADFRAFLAPLTQRFRDPLAGLKDLAAMALRAIMLRVLDLASDLWRGSWWINHHPFFGKWGSWVETYRPAKFGWPILTLWWLWLMIEEILPSFMSSQFYFSQVATVWHETVMVIDLETQMTKDDCYYHSLHLGARSLAMWCTSPWSKAQRKEASALVASLHAREAESNRMREGGRVGWWFGGVCHGIS